MKFGDILRELLEDREISQKQRAEELNFAPSTLGNYIRNLREPDYETLKMLAKHFDVSIDYLLDNPRKDSSLSHDEEHLLSLYRSMDGHTQDLFLKQGALLVQFSQKNINNE